MAINWNTQNQPEQKNTGISWGTSTPLRPKPLQTLPPKSKEESDGFFASIAKDAAETLLVKPAARVAEVVGRTGVLGQNIKRGYEEMADKGESQRIFGIDVDAQKAFGKGGVKQVLGDALTSASYLIPAAKASPLIKSTAGGLIKQGAIQGAKTGFTGGALYGAGAELQNTDATLASTIGAGVVGGGIGLATGGVAGGALAIPKAVQTRFKPTNQQAVAKLQGAYDSLFKATKSGANKLEKLQGTGKDPSKFLAENAVIVDITPDRHIDTKAARELLNVKTNEIDDALTAGLKDSGRFVELQKLQDAALEAIDNSKTRADGSVFDRQAQIKNIFDTYRKIYGESVPLDLVNEMKRGQTGLSRVFDATKPAFAKDVHYQVSKVFRKAVEDGASDLPVADLNKVYADHLSAMDILKKVHGNAIEGGKIGKYFSRTAGAISGSILGTPLGPAGQVGGAVIGDMVGDTVQKAGAMNKVLPPMVKRAIEQGTLKYGSKALTDFQRASNQSRNIAASAIPTNAKNNIEIIRPTLPQNKSLPTRAGGQVFGGVAGITEDENGDLTVDPIMMAAGVAAGRSISSQEARKILVRLEKELAKVTTKNTSSPKAINQQEHRIKSIVDGIRYIQQFLK